MMRMTIPIKKRSIYKGKNIDKRIYLILEKIGEKILIKKFI